MGDLLKREFSLDPVTVTRKVSPPAIQQGQGQVPGVSIPGAVQPGTLQLPPTTVETERPSFLRAFLGNLPFALGAGLSAGVQGKSPEQSFGLAFGGAVQGVEQRRQALVGERIAQRRVGASEQFAQAQLGSAQAQQASAAAQLIRTQQPRNLNELATRALLTGDQQLFERVRSVRQQPNVLDFEEFIVQQLQQGKMTLERAQQLLNDPKPPNTSRIVDRQTGEVILVDNTDLREVARKKLLTPQPEEPSGVETFTSLVRNRQFTLEDVPPAERGAVGAELRSRNVEFFATRASRKFSLEVGDALGALGDFISDVRSTIDALNDGEIPFQIGIDRVNRFSARLGELVKTFGGESASRLSDQDIARVQTLVPTIITAVTDRQFGVASDRAQQLEGAFDELVERKRRLGSSLFGISPSLFDTSVFEREPSARAPKTAKEFLKGRR